MNARIEQSDNFKTHRGPTSAACVLGAAWVVVWLGGFWLSAIDWPLRYGLLGVLLVPLVAAVAVANRQIRDQQLAARHLDTLCKIDAHEYGRRAADQVPPLSEASPWFPVAARVSQALAASRRQLEDAEHARAAMEVRARRAAVEAERVTAILAGLPEPVIAVDHYGELVLANPSAERLFNFDSARTEERALAHLVHCEKLIDLLTETRCRKTSAGRTGDIEVDDPSGQPRAFSVTARGVPGADASGRDGSDGSVQGAVAVLRDVSAQKAIRKQHAEFVSSVSHEMKAPLAGIKAYVELLADGDAEDEETREEFLGIIDGQATRLQRLIDNLLNLARIEAGVVSVHKKPRPLNELLEESIRVMQPAADGKRIELVRDLSPMYLGVLADRDMLLQAAINLLSNAVKYTPDGGKVTLRSRLADNEVRFEVEDTGVGLSEEDCGKVFEKFYRVKKDRQMAAGTGLGLALAKHIVEDVHGGKLTVRSTLGVGSVFTAALPNAGQMT
ncbi:MAG: ATP-binding protein [Pirellulales bacterium]|jgi:two-component system, OmpR family, phosphate regulon sensor histidine kinase PhoR